MRLADNCLPDRTRVTIASEGAVADSTLPLDRALAPWPTHARKMVAKTRVFEVDIAERISPRTGRHHEFGLLRCPDWVNVVALTADQQLVFVRQWRHGTESVTLEVPGGMVDPGETPIEAAARELLEESGFAGRDLQHIGTVAPNPALQSNRCHSFFVRDCRQVAQTHFDSTEDCQLVLLPAAAARELVGNGQIDHALVVAALSHAWLAGLL